MLKFNENGYLEPFQAIVTELETAKSAFTFNKQWLSLFTKTRKKNIKKGFLQLNL